MIADIEAQIGMMLERKASRVGLPPYVAQTSASVTASLEHFVARECPGATLRDIRPMGGGASKEQFVFSIVSPGGEVERCVLRMDPLQTASESDRLREFEMLRAIEGKIPAPRARWIDPDGRDFGRPAAITSFVPGVTKPTTGAGGAISGVGTFFPAYMRADLGRDLIARLADIHRFDWKEADLSSFGVPDATPLQAALWQVNWWSRVWRADSLHANPLMTSAEHWMRENLPRCDNPCVVHGDFRPGNFLFDEPSRRISAVLDWELVHIGDFHEDLAWMLQDAMATRDDGVHLIGGLFERQAFLDQYQQASGNVVMPGSLLFYEVFSSYKCIAIVLATSERAAHDEHNHQDVLLSWLSGIGHIFESSLAALLKRL